MDSLSTFLLIRQMFDLKSIADIFLIASILFLLYRTLLRLGTWKIVAGIGLAMLFFFLASVFDLHGIEWIYNNLSPVAVIALIVIFQPELRKIFERAASMRRIKTSDPGDELPQLISGALIKLSEQKRGAIIVLPGREPLREWVAGGFPIDAKPSFPLVMSIFDPNSPGHDGALFVRNGKFSHFGVRLPISQTAKLPPELGTRHHAAMGLAEKSDALVLVVSEERGTISVFKNAACSSITERKQIEAAICDHWNQMAAFPVDIPTSSIRWPALLQALASLAAAAVFWGAITAGQGEVIEKAISVPVEYTATAPGLAMVGDKLDEVRLHLGGARSDIYALSPSLMSVTINLSKAVAGQQTFLLTEENIRLPKGIQLLDIAPSSVSLSLAALEAREVVVKPQLVGNLPGKRKLKTLEINPATIRALVPAARNAGESIDVTTTPIYLESITGDTVIYCKIIARPSIQPLDKRWPDVEVRISLLP